MSRKGKFYSNVPEQIVENLTLCNTFITVFFVFQTGCGGKITNIFASSGTITSPNYPSNYGSHADCSWRITVPNGFVVRLTFIVFDLESSRNCRYDYVKVEDTSGSLIGLYCGTKAQFTVSSSGRSLYVRFRSDKNVNKGGFRASFTAVNRRPPPGKTFVA